MTNFFLQISSLNTMSRSKQQLIHFSQAKLDILMLTECINLYNVGNELQKQVVHNCFVK
ncbi:hypothetical protein WH47_09014 [Habropoda laboriosa]|uniref:Uncharacterized protein n=1 Tax=Habropoda laboriosa TaxID=597456 RepID=A0A0L7QNN9_9HYME|nr:hypothetical protein WH47_09014 [Habropoda laboriosa]